MVEQADTNLQKDNEFAQFIKTIYQLSFGRTASEDEVDVWRNHHINGLSLPAIYQILAFSPEAQDRRRAETLLLDKVSDSVFIQLVYELIHGRGCDPFEIQIWRERLRSETVTRAKLVAQFFTEISRETLAETRPPVDPYAFTIMGSQRVISLENWRQVRGTGRRRGSDSSRFKSRFRPNLNNGCLVSAVASMYRAGKYIEQFLDNITGQTIFTDACELIIVDADSPDQEYEIIKKYLSRFSNIRYVRVPYRIGIYDAWNLGIQMAQGIYVTNTNMDDLRRSDSFEVQAGTLDTLSKVDIVFQDFYYSFDPHLSFEQVASYGYKTNLPPLTAYNLIAYNSPHNAPMWRKSIHSEIGYFNQHYSSAADYDFWIRAFLAGKMFYKLNTPHIAYYHNPEGSSTRADTTGVVEAKEISRKYFRKLIHDNWICDPEAFLARLSASLGDIGEGINEGELDSSTVSRYELVQRCMRQASKQLRFSQLGPIGSEPPPRAKPLRLLIDGVFFQLNDTGIARIWRTLIPRLKSKQGWTVFVLDRGGVANFDGVELIPFPAYKMRYTAEDSRQIQMICDQYKIDVFTSTYYTTPLSTPMMLMVHDMIPERLGFELTNRDWMDKQLAILYAQKFVCVSHNTKKDLLEYYPELPEARIAVENPGIDTGVFYVRPDAEVLAFREEHGLKRPYFLCVGSRAQHLNYKNTNLFFQALHTLGRSDFDVLCVGGEPAIDAEALRALPDGVQAKRVVLGDADLARAYTGAIGLAYPSLYEGFGLPVIEAMACGCPVITTSRGSLEEAAGNAARLVDGHSVAEMRDALGELFSPEIREQLRTAGLARASQCNWDRMEDGLVAGIEALAAEAGKGFFESFFARWSEFREIQATVDVSSPFGEPEEDPATERDENVVPAVATEQFVSEAYRIILGREPTSRDLELAADRLARAEITRLALVEELLAAL